MWLLEHFKSHTWLTFDLYGAPLLQWFPIALRVGPKFLTETIKAPCDLPAFLRLSEGPTPLGQHVSGTLALLFPRHAVALSCCWTFSHRVPACHVLS